MDYSFVEGKSEERGSEREADEKEGRPNHANGYTNLTQQDVARRGHKDIHKLRRGRGKSESERDAAAAAAGEMEGQSPSRRKDDD